jgi:hypothetical protein
MATCNLCPPGKRDVPDEKMAGHLRTVHPEVRADGSTVLPDVSLEPPAAVRPGEGDWQSSR